MKKIISLVFFVVALTTIGLAQTGKIAGVVTDQKTSETLIGLTVKVDGTTIGISTDVEGRYSLGNLQPGTYKLNFSYMGYKTKSITDVEVKAGQVTTLDVIMEEDTGQALDEVVVTVTARQESVGSLYAQQKNNITVSSGISSEQIKRSPDRNTSDVLKRVSGASVQDNKFVVIRGLADRYNSATLNNAILPSTEPDRKAFSFDIIPSNMIDRVVVSKTASPDLPGDFSGGVIQIFTRDVPDEDFLSFTAGYSINSQSTFKDFLSNQRNSTDWLGFDDGTRWLPDGFPSNRRRFQTASFDKKVAYSRLMPNSYREVNSTALPVQNYQLTWGNTSSFKNNASFGSIVALTYRNGKSISNINRYDYETTDDPYYAYNDQQFRYNTSIGALANFAYKQGKTKIALKNVFNRVFDDAYNDRSGYNTGNLIDLRFNSSELIQKGLINSQLEGDHAIGEKGFKLNWNANYALISRDQPDFRTIYYQSNIGSGNPYTLVDRNSRRFFSDLYETNYGGSVSATLPFQMGKEKQSLKMGVFKLYKTRDFFGRIFNYQEGPTFNIDKRSLGKNDIFAPENMGSNGYVLDDFTNNTDKYDALSDLNAGYAMLDNKFGKLRAVWGLRVENFYQHLNAVDVSNAKIDAEQEYYDFLPSANLSYALNDKSNLRLSASRTVSRPEFRELAPFAFYDYVESASISGNPNLKRSQNTNADFRYEIYPGAGEAITVSTFFKHFKDPIERVLNSASNPDLRRISFGNAESATAYGIELEVRKRMNFMGEQKWLENLTAFANLSYIKSDVVLGITGFEDRPLQGQSPYLINLGLQYVTPNSGLAFSALFNKAGQRIANVGYQGYSDIYEKGRDVLDLQVTKKIFRNNAELKLNLSDVLNQNVIFYQNTDDNKAYSKGTDRVMSSARIGFTSSLSFTYNFKLNK